MDLYIKMLDKLNSDETMIESISEMPIGTGLLGRCFLTQKMHN